VHNPETLICKRAVRQHLDGVPADRRSGDRGQQARRNGSPTVRLSTVDTLSIKLSTHSPSSTTAALDTLRELATRLTGTGEEPDTLAV
jgi:hypothetical protein